MCHAKQNFFYWKCTGGQVGGGGVFSFFLLYIHPNNEDLWTIQVLVTNVHNLYIGQQILLPAIIMLKYSYSYIVLIFLYFFSSSFSSWCSPLSSSPCSLSSYFYFSSHLFSFGISRNGK